MKYSNLRDVSAVDKNTNKRNWESKGERASEGSDQSQHQRDFMRCIWEPSRLIPWLATDRVVAVPVAARRELVVKLSSHGSNDIER
jgi:hypothetical protein